MTAYTAYRAHMMACPICAKGGPYCEEGNRLGCAFESDNRHLDSLAGMCWEPPLDITYPSEAEMDADYARWEASQKGKL